MGDLLTSPLVIRCWKYPVKITSSIWEAPPLPEMAGRWEYAGILLGWGCVPSNNFFFHLVPSNGSPCFQPQARWKGILCLFRYFAELFFGLESFALICHRGFLNYYGTVRRSGAGQYRFQAAARFIYAPVQDNASINAPTVAVSDSPPPLQRFHGRVCTLYFRLIFDTPSETIFLTLGAHLQDEFVPDDEPAGISEQDLFRRGSGWKKRTVTLNFGLGYRRF